MDLELSLSPIENTSSDDATMSSSGASALEVCLDIDKDSVKSSGFTREELSNAVRSGVETACVQGK